MRQLALPALRMRAAAEEAANEARLGGGVHAHPSVHLDIARPGTLAAETEVGAGKSRRLHDITRVMVIEETYKQRRARGLLRAAQRKAAAHAPFPTPRSARWSPVTASALSRGCGMRRCCKAACGRHLPWQTSTPRSPSPSRM